MDIKLFIITVYKKLELNETPVRLMLIFLILFIFTMEKFPNILNYYSGHKKFTIAITTGIFLEHNINRVNWEFKVNGINYIGHGELELIKKYKVKPKGMRLYVVYSEKWPRINFLVPTIPIGTKFNPDTLSDDFCIEMLKYSQFAIKK